MPAFMYLLEEKAHIVGEGGPWTKIGFSMNPPEWRLNSNLKRGNPRDLLLAAVYEFSSTKEAREAEGVTHVHFNEFAHQKEWFQVSWHTVAEWCDDVMGWRRRVGG